MLIAGRLLTDPAAPLIAGWLRVEHGRIAEIGEGDPPGREKPDAGGGPGAIITPAFIDAHTHLPQFDAVGCDGMPLLEWLERIVYPAERWWGAGAWPGLARGAIARLIREGTFGVAAWLTSHADASRGTLDVLAASGLRCIAGRVAMDRAAPDDLTAEDRWRGAQRPTPGLLVEPSVAQAGGRARVEASINPRFAIACSEELLAEVGWLRREREAAGRPLWVQTHLAESIAECEAGRALFPSDANPTRVYERLGLLGERTLLAHCCHLSSDEWALLANHRAIAVHCPTANLFLRSGFFDLDATEAHGVRIALGSDLGAGPDLAMPRVARAMIETCKTRALLASGSGGPGAGERAIRIPTPAEAWRRITLGNALALGWPDAGRLAVGAAADLLVLRAPETWLDAHLVGRLLYGWSAALIESRILAGRLAGAP